MLNKVTYQGRFTADPEIKDVGGFALCEFTIAWSEKYKDNEKKCFLRCKAWRSQADHIVKYFKKGQECVIEGQLLTEQWEKDGDKQSRTVCNIEKIHFAGSKASNSSNDETAPAATSEDGFMKIPEGVDEELPFS
jgi:single-strand DNA-binding protein